MIAALGQLSRRRRGRVGSAEQPGGGERGAGGSTVGAAAAAAAAAAAPGPVSGRLADGGRAVLQGAVPGPGHPPPSSPLGEGRGLPGLEQPFRRAIPPALLSRAMEPSGSLFPSLVVVGHVVTLAAVWHWHRGRRRAQDEQGKPAGGYCPGCCHQPPPRRQEAEGGAGKGPPPSRPCVSLSPPLPSRGKQLWHVLRSGVAPASYPASLGRAGALWLHQPGAPCWEGGLRTCGEWVAGAVQEHPVRKGGPSLAVRDRMSTGDCAQKPAGRHRPGVLGQVLGELLPRTEVGMGVGGASPPLRRGEAGPGPRNAWDRQPGCALPAPCSRSPALDCSPWQQRRAAQEGGASTQANELGGGGMGTGVLARGTAPLGTCRSALGIAWSVEACPQWGWPELAPDRDAGPAGP